ncbi:MAG: hypothetical protein ACFFER_01750 [Candidatus Thorarchaeota archaeon]
MSWVIAVFKSDETGTTWPPWDGCNQEQRVRAFEIGMLVNSSESDMTGGSYVFVFYSERVHSRTQEN